MNSEINRLYGLDSLRSLAIIAVFMCHFKVLTDFTIFDPIASCGGFGVDLFFVLSGYLIGNQIFSHYARSERSFSLSVFLMRRFLRTLPNYFFVLFLYFSIPNFSEKPLITPLWKFITFTQNFGLSSGLGFSHAWSLCVEEQFYLIFPLVSFLLFKKIKNRSPLILFYSVLLGGVAFGILIRAILWFLFMKDAGSEAGKAFTTLIYYPTYARLDGLIAGVALSFIKNFHKTLWVKITQRKNFYFLIGCLSIIWCYFIFTSTMSLFKVAFGYPILALSTTCLVISALSPGSFLYKHRIPGANFVATIAYSLYLIHKPVIHFFKNLIGTDHPYLLAFYSALGSFLCAYLIYIVIEKPFLILRDWLGNKKPNASKIVNMSAIRQKIL